MVSHPETGSDSPIGSDRDRGRDRLSTNTPGFGASQESILRLGFLQPTTQNMYPYKKSK